MQSTLLVFAAKIWLKKNGTAVLELNQEEATALVHHEPQVSALSDHLLPESKNIVPALLGFSNW